MTNPIHHSYFILSGDIFNDSLLGKSGKVNICRTCISPKTQYFPDCHIQPNFPNVVLEPGEKYFKKQFMELHLNELKQLIS